MNSEIVFSTEFSSICQQRKMKAFYLVLSQAKFPAYKYANRGLEIKVGKTKLGPYQEQQLQDGQVFKFEKLEKNSFCELHFNGWNTFKMPIENGTEDFTDESIGFHFHVKKFLIVGKDKIAEFEESL